MALSDLARKSSWWLLLALVLTLALSSTIQDSRTAEAGGQGLLRIFKTGPDGATPLQNACFKVEDVGHVLLFEVCDNNFQGPPQSHPLCVPDGVCEDEVVGTQGEIQVSIAFADDYSVVESKAPPGYVADPAKKQCPSICELLFVNQPESVGGIAVAPDLDTTLLQTADSSGTNAALFAGVAVAIAAAFVVLGAAAWYARRRFTS